MFEWLACVRRRHLDTNPSLPFGDDRIAEGDGINSFKQELLRHSGGERRVAQQDGNDGMCSSDEAIAQAGQLRSKESGVPMERGSQRVTLLHKRQGTSSRFNGDRWQR